MLALIVCLRCFFFKLWTIAKPVESAPFMSETMFFSANHCMVFAHVKRASEPYNGDRSSNTNRDSQQAVPCNDDSASASRKNLRHQTIRRINRDYIKIITDGIRTQARNEPRNARLWSYGSPYLGERHYTTRPLQLSIRPGEFTYLCECIQASNCVIFVDTCCDRTTVVL